MTDKEQELDKSTNVTVADNFSRPEMQEVWAFLRERFLRVVTGVVGILHCALVISAGKPSEFNLHENSKVTVKFRGCNVDGLEVYVRDLETPLGKVPEVTLRSMDIVHFRVKNIPLQQ